MSDDQRLGTRIQRIGAYGVCLSSADQLLLSRFSPPDLRWVLPGGGVDHGEHPAAAVVREVLEETGYEVEVTRLLSVESDTWQTPDQTRIHSVNILYDVEIVGGELANEAGGGSDVAAWVALGGVAKLNRSELVDVGLARRAAATSVRTQHAHSDPERTW